MTSSILSIGHLTFDHMVGKYVVSHSKALFKTHRVENWGKADLSFVVAHMRKALDTYQRRRPECRLQYQSLYTST
jgi:hypothetical protein